MIETLGNWGDFISGVAVVVSLVYVGIQIRSSVQQTKVQNYTRGAEMWLQFTSIIGDAETWELWHKGSKEYASLNQVDQARFDFLISMYFGMIDTFMVQERAGVTGDSENCERQLGLANAVFIQPGVQAWWLKAKGRVLAPNIDAYLTQSKALDDSVEPIT
jgi:hypothetical protein